MNLLRLHSVCSTFSAPPCILHMYTAEQRPGGPFGMQKERMTTRFSYNERRSWYTMMKVMKELNIHCKFFCLLCFCRAYALQCCVCLSSSVCTECIVAKRCVI